MCKRSTYQDFHLGEMNQKPIAERIDWLMDLSKEHSADYCEPEEYLARKRYLAEHPTHVAVLKCMDGRIHIPYATQTPMGIIQPFRNLGGMFDLGWPYLGEVLFNSINGAINQGRRSMVLITYHYSKSDEHRGCAGFNYDCAAAKKHTYEIKNQVEKTFGTEHQTVYPVVMGFETDEDAIILHGDKDGELNLAETKNLSDDELYSKLQTLYPDMPESMLKDLMPLVLGNIRHIEEIRKIEREPITEHREWIICVGRGFDFLHVPNIALIVGPYSPELSVPITKAASIIKNNMDKGRIPADGFLLLASAPYNQIGVDRARAEMKSKFLSQFASDVIKKELPDFHKLMIQKTAVLNWKTRALEFID